MGPLNGEEGGVPTKKTNNDYEDDDYTNAYNRQRQLASGIGSAFSGAASLYGQGNSLANRYNGMQTNAPAEQLDAYGNPLYNLGGLNSQLDITPRGARAGDILSGAGTGAAAGAALGPVGAIVGGGVGALTSIIGGWIGKNKGDHRKRVAAQNLMAAQKRYSVDKTFANNKELSFGDYQRMNNNYSRLHNLYDVQSGQQQ